MKRILILALTLGSVVTAVPSDAAGKSTPRVEKVPYVGSAVPQPTGGFNCAGYQQSDDRPGVGCVYFRPIGSDRAVEVEIEDAAGMGVSAWLVQSRWDEGKGVYTWSQINRFCTETEDPVVLSPKANIVFVTLWQARCQDGTPAPATTGEVTFTIHQR